MQRTWIAIALVAGLAGCGKKDEAKPTTPAVSDAATATLAMPALGIDSPKRTNYVYGAGAKDHERALAAFKAQPRDWTGVRSAAEAALAKDGDHLDAHRLLASALAQPGGDPAAATQHLTTALAGDWLRWGPTLAEDADLAAYLATPEGKALAALNEQMRAAVTAWLGKSAVVLGRRGPFKWPAKPGAQWATTRGELYAYSVDDKRFLRLTHSEHSVAAYVPSSDGKEVAVIGFDKVELPEATKKDAPPLLARSWVQTFDPATWRSTGKRATVGKARAVAVHYGPGDQLLVTSFAAQGRWGQGAATTVSIDRATGKAAKTATPADLGARAQVSFDEAVVEMPIAGVAATWEGEPPAATSFALTAIGKTIEVPSAARALRASMAVSPSGRRVAFATWADPCAKDGAVPSLYAVDATSGQLRHILTASSRFGARWLDDDRLVYEDDTGGLRVFDATAGRETARIADKAGLALRGLSATPVPICKQEPIDVEIDDGSEAPLPHEEGGGEPGPATTP